MMTTFLSKHNKKVAISLRDGLHSCGIKLTDYQVEAIRRMQKQDAYALFLEQGLGKTITCLTEYALDCKTSTMILFHAPKVIVTSWKQDIEKTAYDFDVFAWADYSAINTKMKEDFERVMQSNKKTIFLFNIDVANKELKIFPYIKKIFKERTDISLVIDQSQAIKNPKAIRTKTLINLAQQPNVVRKRILEGAPNEEGNQELYSQFAFLNQDIIGCEDYFQFQHRFCQIEKGSSWANGRQVSYTKITGNKNTERLLALINPYTSWKKRKSDVVIHKKIEFALSTKEKEVYKSIVKKQDSGISDDVMSRMKKEYGIDDTTIIHAIVMMQKLQQVCSGLLTDDKTKTDILIQLLTDEIPKKKQVVVFASFKKEVDNICTALKKKKIDCAGIHSQLKDNDNTIKDFMDKKLKVIVATHKSIGVGLNLMNAHYMVFHSVGYSSRVRKECVKRIDRLGQENQPVVYDLVAMYDKEHTNIDEYILQTLDHKKSISDFTYELYKQLQEDFKGD